MVLGGLGFRRVLQGYGGFLGPGRILQASMGFY